MKTFARISSILLLCSSSFALAQTDDLARLGAWEAAGRTGAAHAALAEQVGRWEATIEMWMSPDAPPETTTYQVTRTLELDGRVLHEDWSGTFMDQPFQGIGRTGYDNTTGRYWSTWTDNLSTTLMVSHGTRKDDGRIVLTGRYADPVDGAPVDTRFVWSFPAEGQERMEAYETRDGTTVMNMRMQLRRLDD